RGRRGARRAASQPRPPPRARRRAPAPSPRRRRPPRRARATGHIGSTLCRALSEAGVAVRALVRPSSDRSALEALGAEIVEGDVLDPGSLRRGAAGVDAVFHLAAVFDLHPKDLALGGARSRPPCARRGALDPRRRRRCGPRPPREVRRRLRPGPRAPRTRRARRRGS
ncbi:MAG: NAD(P)H-binding protein, partial [Myxococcales bacterium]|nr:NAD(P)H-binding protein [Myxococcales bacterium]